MQFTCSLFSCVLGETLSQHSAGSWGGGASRQGGAWSPGNPSPQGHTAWARRAAPWAAGTERGDSPGLRAESQAIQGSWGEREQQGKSVLRKIPSLGSAEECLSFTKHTYLLLKLLPGYICLSFSADFFGQHSVWDLMCVLHVCYHHSNVNLDKYIFHEGNIFTISEKDRLKIASRSLLTMLHHILLNKIFTILRQKVLNRNKTLTAKYRKCWIKYQQGRKNISA